MVVALRLSAPNLLGVDRRLDGQRRGLSGIELHRPMDVLEMPAHPADHHMADLKLRGRVSRLKSPSWHGWFSPPVGLYPTDIVSIPAIFGNSVIKAETVRLLRARLLCRMTLVKQGKPEARARLARASGLIVIGKVPIWTIRSSRWRRVAAIASSWAD